MISSVTTAVKPLGIFGCLASQLQMRQLAETLRNMMGAIPENDRSRIADYLRTCPIVLALMESTRDVINDAFAVPGGSAIHTDGCYYWRRDAAEYVSYYGVALLPEFLEHGARSNWAPKRLSRDDVLDIDDYLAAHIRPPPAT